MQSGTHSKGDDGKANRPNPQRPRARPLFWDLPPLAWVWHAGRTARPGAIGRILVCAPGDSSFLLAKNLPQSEVVALAASAGMTRSMRVSGRRRKLSNLVVETGVLDQEALAEVAGRNFDLVLATLPVEQVRNAPHMLQNMADCTAPNGALFLRFPGPGHPLHRASSIFSKLGVAVSDCHSLAPTEAALLRLISAMGGEEFPPGRETCPEQLPTLADWMPRLAAHGFQFAANVHTPATLAKALPYGSMAPFLSLSRSDLAALLEQVALPACQECVFVRTMVTEPPWQQPEVLADWTPHVQFWPRDKIPAQQAPWNQMISAEIEIARIFPKRQLHMSRYLLELLRISDGQTPLGSLIEQIPHQAALADIAGALCFFFHTGIIGLYAPESS